MSDNCPTYQWCDNGLPDRPCDGEHWRRFPYTAASLTTDGDEPNWQGAVFPVVAPAVRLDTVTSERRGFPASVSLHVTQTTNGAPHIDTEVEMHPYEARLLAEQIQAAAELAESALNGDREKVVTD